MTDRLGRFLYDKGVPPDDFQSFRGRVVGYELAAIEVPCSGSLGIYTTDERGSIITKLAPELLRLAVLKVNFSVSFIDGETAKGELATWNPNDEQKGLFSVWFDEKSKEPLFKSYDGRPLGETDSDESTIF
jgi:hypothetical protein